MAVLCVVPPSAPQQAAPAALWAQARRAPIHAAPPQAGPRARWHVAAARARIAFGELREAEELLVVFLEESAESSLEEPLEGPLQ